MMFDDTDSNETSPIAEKLKILLLLYYPENRALPAIAPDPNKYYFEDTLNQLISLKQTYSGDYIKLVKTFLNMVNSDRLESEIMVKSSTEPNFPSELLEGALQKNPKLVNTFINGFNFNSRTVISEYIKNDKTEMVPLLFKYGKKVHPDFGGEEIFYSIYNKGNISLLKYLLQTDIFYTSNNLQLAQDEKFAEIKKILIRRIAHSKGGTNKKNMYTLELVCCEGNPPIFNLFATNNLIDFSHFNDPSENKSIFLNQMVNTLYVALKDQESSSSTEQLSETIENYRDILSKIVTHISAKNMNLHRLDPQKISYIAKKGICPELCSKFSENQVEQLTHFLKPRLIVNDSSPLTENPNFEKEKSNLLHQYASLNKDTPDFDINKHKEQSINELIKLILSAPDPAKQSENLKNNQ